MLFSTAQQRFCYLRLNATFNFYKFVEVLPKKPKFVFEIHYYFFQRYGYIYFEVFSTKKFFKIFLEFKIAEVFYFKKLKISCFKGFSKFLKNFFFFY